MNVFFQSFFFLPSSEALELTIETDVGVLVILNYTKKLLGFLVGGSFSYTHGLNQSLVLRSGRNFSPGPIRKGH